MCFAWIPEQTTTFAFCDTYTLIFMTEVESVHCAVRTDTLYKTDKIKGEGIPLQAWAGLEGTRRLRLRDFKTIDT